MTTTTIIHPPTASPSPMLMMMRDAVGDDGSSGEFRGGGESGSDVALKERDFLSHQCRKVSRSRESIDGDGDDEEDEDEEEWNDWQGTRCRPERWAPLGANDSDIEENGSSCKNKLENVYEKATDVVEIRKMKEDHEQLTSALLALTTHFAQVQFRIQQVVAAPLDEKELLLKDLEQFTFRGIPSAVTSSIRAGVIDECEGPNDAIIAIHSTNPGCSEEDNSSHSKTHGNGLNCSYFCQMDNTMQEKIKLQKERQKDLIGQLKIQLEELESYAYHSGDAGLPQSVLLERHKVIIDHLREKLNLNVDRLETVSNEDLKYQVDQAITELVNPIKMKEHLVEQLKTQISDLERFIQYLHGGGDGTAPCTCPKLSRSKNAKLYLNNKKRLNSQGRNDDEEAGDDGAHCSEEKCSHAEDCDDEEEVLRTKTVQLMRKALTLIQMFAVAQFGCSATQLPMTSLRTGGIPKGNHWGDLRASLDLAVVKVVNLAIAAELPADSDYTSDCEDVAPCSVICNQALTAAVRKDLAGSLASLLEHGLMPVGQSQGFFSLANCFSTQSEVGSGFLTAWDLLLKYYQIKNGERYNATPARKLSQSFGLEIVGSTTITTKQMLLTTIDNIITSHSRYKRSPESHFKAFVCAGLNCKKLVLWIRLIMRTQEIMEKYYQPWSYASKTGCEDSLRSLDKLSSINFDLPVDLAIRQFQNIKDAFQ